MQNEISIEAPMSPNERATIVFGRYGWHTISYLKELFVPGKDCDREGCGGKTLRRCMVNLNGYVVEVDLCEKCAIDWDRMGADSFPFKISRSRHTSAQS